MNYAKVENAISSELSKFSVCFFVKTVIDQADTSQRYCPFSYATEDDHDIAIYIHTHKVKFKVGSKKFG